MGGCLLPGKETGVPASGRLPPAPASTAASHPGERGELGGPRQAEGTKQGAWGVPGRGQSRGQWGAIEGWGEARWGPLTWVCAPLNPHPLLSHSGSDQAPPLAIFSQTR